MRLPARRRSGTKATPGAVGAAKPNRTLLLGLGAGAVLVAVAVAAFALARATAPRTEPSSPRQNDPVATTPAESETPPADAIPEDVVTALYEALSRGDTAGAKATFAPGFGIDESITQAWGDPAYEIELVTAGDDQGEIKVQVRETGGGLSAEDVVTWLLREGSDGWRISGWMIGRVQDDPGFGADAPVEPVAAQSAEEQAAIDAVSEFLRHRMAGAADAMKSVATEDMPSRQSAVFAARYGDFVAFEITAVYTEAGGCAVAVREDRASGLQMHEYVVVTRDGKALVDQMR